MTRKPARSAKLLVAVLGVLGLAVAAMPPGASALTTPSISSFNPDRGGAGVQVTISGSGFTGATEVDFGTASATYNVIDDATIDAAVPSAATQGPISVTAGGTTATSTTDFTFIPIQHIVVVFQENESFNSIFGGYCNQNPTRCDAVTKAPLSEGGTIQIAPMPDFIPNLAHSVNAQQTAIDGGKMDGFDKEYGCKASNGIPNSIPYGCFVHATHKELQNTWTFANTYAISDRTFEMKRSPSWGGHIEIASASLERFTGDNPTFSNPDHISGLTKGPGWGCASNMDTWWINSSGQKVYEPSCIPAKGGTGTYRPTLAHWMPTIMDRLDSAGLGWHIYADTSTTLWQVCPQFAECTYGSQASKVVPVGQFFTDVSAGTLPAFSLVTPSSANSQHNNSSMTKGDNWLGNVVAAVQANPSLWSSTAIFITYDDCGCFYDPIPPPSAAYGIRVPMMIISPYAKPGYTDTNTASYASVLKFTEETFGLTALNATDSAAYDYLGAFNFGSAPAMAPAPIVHHDIPKHSRRMLKKYPPKANEAT